MIYSANGTSLYSPRDLIAYLEGDFAAWCERMQAERDSAGGPRSADLEPAIPDVDDELALLARMGDEHEQRYLTSLRQQQPALVELTRDSPAGDTLAAMRSGAPVIYQAHLSGADWHGYPDFLVRVAGPSTLGGHHYEAWDTKLALRAKPYFLVQLAAYAELLEAIQGVRPAGIVFVLGNGSEGRFSTHNYYYYYLQLKQSFLEFQADWDDGRMPDPGLDKSWGRWSIFAKSLLAESDHLSLIANISRGQVRRLEDAAITTLCGLAASTVARVPRMSDAVLDRLRTQAQLQLASRGKPRPVWQVRTPDPEEPRRGLALLPPASRGDVFFDMEGFPFAEGGLEYLWGAVTVEDDTPRFHDWWAHDATEERTALDQFIDWVWTRWKQDPTLHIYHYASYEPSAVERLKQKYGKHAVREAQVDDLLRQDVFIDLYTVVRQGLTVGTASYSLKQIERLYLAPRQGDVVSASGSVIEYQRWLDSGEPRRWEDSRILSGIRDYNRVDCESTWGLREWLLERQREHGIAYLPASDAGREEKPKSEATEAAEQLAARLKAKAALETDTERRRITELLGWLVEFHRREDRPMWWWMFKWNDMSADELCDQLPCLGGLRRTSTPPRKIKRSSGLEYGFNPDQDTKLQVGDKCFIARTEPGSDYTIIALDQELGRVELKVGPGKSLPDELSLIPYEFFGAEGIKLALAHYAASWEAGTVLSQAVDDLLSRRPPRVRDHPGGPLLPESGRFLLNVCDLVGRLDGTTLCIQGPPGTGKTYTAAAIIAELMRRGKRIGVAANSHKVILNLLGAVVAERSRAGESGGIFKVEKGEGEEEEALVMSGAVALIESKEVLVSLTSAVLVGGTAWVFSRPELQGQFDYLFIDEAGQVSLANAVAVGQAAKNLILVGDQMQLAQPMQGSHPGETGLSCLEYVLQDHATIPPELGVFLGVSYRMHSGVCRFISDAVYEGRLTSFPDAERHRVIAGKHSSLVSAENGIVWVPVPHEGNTQSSEEEVEAIKAITDELLRRTVVDNKGVTRPMTLADILFVAPFNAQVRCLTKVLGKSARVGSVDRFQGQEAPVVIVSLCSSTLEEAPRGAEFLLSPNRLNVAISRAQALAIVVGSSELPRVRCRTVEEMKVVNLLCRVIHYSESLRGGNAPEAIRPVSLGATGSPRAPAGPSR